MGALSDIMLDTGGMDNILSVHGELFEVLGQGPDTGKFFTGAKLSAPDYEIETALSGERRGHRILHFKKGASPTLSRNDLVRDSSGGVWQVVDEIEDSENSVDYEIKQFHDKDER